MRRREKDEMAMDSDLSEYDGILFIYVGAIIL